MTDDAELLRMYVEFHSNADFTEFVGRHFSFVYHAALRRTGGRADLAQDVTQYVFTTVARQASALSEHRVLAGWLYTTTRLAANNLLREERRRSAREQEAHFMSDASSPNSDPQWHRVRQELDSVMDQLPGRVHRESADRAHLPNVGATDRPPTSFDFGGLRFVAAELESTRNGADKAAPSETRPATTNRAMPKPRRGFDLAGILAATTLTGARFG